MKRVKLPWKDGGLRRSLREQTITFVELIVVLAVVLVPISLLLPIVSKTRERASLVRCASNMRQIQMAVMSYAEQNRGTLPIPSFAWDPPTSKVRWAIRVDAVGQYSWEQGALWDMLPGPPGRRAQLFMCPADEAFVGDHHDGALPRNFSYNLNAWLRGPQPLLWQTRKGITGLRTSQLARPAEKILIAEEREPYDGCFEGYWPLADRHLRKGNQCFADGHVELFDPAPFAALPPFDNASPAVLKYVRLTP